MKFLCAVGTVLENFFGLAAIVMLAEGMRESAGMTRAHSALSPSLIVPILALLLVLDGALAVTVASISTSELPLDADGAGAESAVRVPVPDPFTAKSMCVVPFERPWS